MGAARITPRERAEVVLNQLGVELSPATDEARDIIAAAIARAEDEALEDAAQRALPIVKNRKGREGIWCSRRKRIADEIRALQPSAANPA